MSRNDADVVRDLARRYADLCRDDPQAERRNAWRRHNSLKRTRPLIYVRAFAWWEMPESRCVCEDPFYRPYEGFFRQALFRARFEDDFIFEPWVVVPATVRTPPGGVWGLPTAWVSSDDPRGAKKIDPPIKTEGDAERLVPPQHEIDEEATARDFARLQDVLGDLLPVCVDRAPAYRVWNGDISTQLIYLRGIDQVMWDIMDRPAWLHRVLAFMRDGILRTHEQAERAGDWRACNHENQAMPYAEELPDPSAEDVPVPRRRLWTFCASQEFTLVGPKMFDEFMLAYQRAIIEPFGLSAYGCCEDLTQKIGVLRQVRNLRRIAVAPRADAARCAEQIGGEYVVSYRPSPADMVAYGFDPERIERILRRDLAACRANGCHVDITLKDVETVQGDPTRISRWVQLTRRLAEELLA